MIDLLCCPECGNVLDFDGITRDGGLYSCDVCETLWKWLDKEQQWVVDDPDRKNCKHKWRGDSHGQYCEVCGIKKFKEEI